MFSNFETKKASKMSLPEVKKVNKISILTQTMDKANDYYPNMAVKQMNESISTKNGNALEE
jgi:hypothetical protein